MTRRDDVPEWAKPGLDDPDAYDVPAFEGSGPAKEAARHVVGCRCLSCALTRLRMLLRSEIPMKMTQHATPVLRDWEGIPEHETDEGGIGPPLTAALHRYLSNADHWGVTRLGMLSIIEVSDWCAARHPVHRRPMFTRTMCGQMTFEAAYLNQELGDLFWLHADLTMPQIRGMLETALAHAEQWREDRFARWTKVPGEPEPLPERRRVA